ncbi:MAG: YIP1 family protein [candidate division Zixibacteria bacterium]|nr:YIP1 family protein [candidate division Zixibacteria bacterium]
MMNQSDVPGNALQQTSTSGFSFRGLVEIFYQPASFFEKLKNNPKVLVPYLVFGILILTFFWFAQDLVFEMQMQSEQFQEQMQGQVMTPVVEKITKISIVVFGSISLCLSPLLATLFALFWGNFVYAGKASFKALLSVMVYSEIIYAVGIVILIPLMLAKESILVSLSLGVLAANAGPESLLYLALSKIDVFNIWEIIVVGIGLSTIYGLPRNKGYWLSVLSMGMISILHIVFTAIGKLLL